jgi:hypothetical protein
VTLPRRPAALVALCLALVALFGAGCSDGDRSEPSADVGSTTTAAASTTASDASSSVPDPPIPDDAVWVLGDPDLTFVRVDHADSVPLGSNTDGDAPIVEGTELLLEYRTPAGGAVLVEQAELVDPSDAMAYVVDPGEAGYPPTLTTILGTSRVAISGPEDDLRPLADTLEPVDPSVLDEMVHEVSARIIDGGLAEPVLNGITFHRPGPGGDAVACLDGQEPAGCANADRYGPLVMAPIPQDDVFTVVGCISQPMPVGQVTVDGTPVPTQTAACGEAFSLPGIAPGRVAIAFDDGPGGVGTYTISLP